MNDLKPCPFCGGEAEYVSQHAKGKRWAVACTMTSKAAADEGVPMCRCRTPFSNDKGHARDVWNTRAETSSETCEMEYGGDVTEDTKLVLGAYFCSECGSPTYNDCVPYYCPYCGRKAVSA